MIYEKRIWIIFLKTCLLRVKVAQKNFKISRCFRSYFVSLFESFQKVTERSRMIVTIQNRIILNTFSRQPTKKTIQGNIMCVSNFHVHMFTNVLKFWWYDPNLSSPGQATFYCFPFAHHFLAHSCIMFIEFSSACNWKKTSRSPASKRRTLFFFGIQVSLFFFLGEIKDIVTHTICGKGS